VARKIVFVLHDVQGYKHSEIAKMMDCSVGNFVRANFIGPASS